MDNSSKRAFKCVNVVDKSRNKNIKTKLWLKIVFDFYCVFPTNAM